jgi:hypothetical protein
MRTDRTGTGYRESKESAGVRRVDEGDRRAVARRYVSGLRERTGTPAWGSVGGELRPTAHLCGDVWVGQAEVAQVPRVLALEAQWLVVVALEKGDE